MVHLSNWLQLLEALSLRCMPTQTHPRGGSAPDRDKQEDVEFTDEEDYRTHTVLGINR